MLPDIETPAVVVDLARMDANVQAVGEYAKRHGLALRPHAKTHKSVRVAREQVARGAVGLTCATPREAEILQVVADDILVAYPPVDPARARRVAALSAKRVIVALDSAEAVTSIAAAARSAGRTVEVYVELDLGMRRVGVADAAAGVELARRVVDSPGLGFAGILFYPGHVRQAVAAQDEALRDLSTRLGEAIAAFDAADLHPPAVSGGSTPTLWRSHEVEGVTEIRPGTYVYNDRTTAAIGACAWDDCALTVLATVVSTAVPGQAVIDAGTKALGREPIRGAADEGFGALLDRPDVIVRSMSEEHGILDLTRTDWRPIVGDRVRVVPNHVCVVVHLFDEVVGIRGNEVVERWPVDARGR